MTTQIAVKLSDDVVARLDDLVSRGIFANRSAAVRRGLEVILRTHERRRTDEAFRDGFEDRPETDEELREAERLAVEAIHDEPWEKWW